MSLSLFKFPPLVKGEQGGFSLTPLLYHPNRKNMSVYRFHPYLRWGGAVNPRPKPQMMLGGLGGNR